MRYAVLLGISVVGYDTKVNAMTMAMSISESNPTRLVRIIDSHTDDIVRTYRGGEETDEGQEL